MNDAQADWCATGRSQRHLLTKEEVAAGERALRVLVGNPRAHMGPASPRAAQRVATPPARAPGP